MEGKIVYFEKPGIENTDETLRIAKQRAKELEIKTIVVASTEGTCAVKASKLFKGMKVVVVTHETGFQKPNFQWLHEENKKKAERNGAIVLTTMPTFAGVSRAIRYKFNTLTETELIANVLRMFGQGMKVVVEITFMATDAGLVQTDEDIIAIGGSGRGADTAVVIKAANSTKFFDLKVKEILCKPR